jgi:photosystem II stability/assembly factor-like uncharacterized protein
MKSGCGNLDTLFARPDSDVLIAGVYLAGLWASTDGDTDWAALGTGKGSASISNGPLSLVFDPLDPDRFWEAGIYGDDAGVYETKDGGKTFAAVGDLFHTDSVSLDFSDEQRKTLLAGGHEAAQTLWKTTDGGATWKSVGRDLPADRWCTIALILDAENYLVGCGQSGGLTGIFRSSDAGGHWTKVSDGGGSGRPLLASDGSIYWTTASNGQLLRSVDLGLTWVEMMPADVLPGKSPIELPDGRIAALGPQTVVVSADHGETWDYASGGLPYTDAAGLLYSSFQRAFFIWHNDCQDAVLDDAVMRFDFDYETQ